MTCLGGEWLFSWFYVHYLAYSFVTCFQSSAATAGRGLTGSMLCNLRISTLGPPQEIWPKVEVCQVSNPLEWESSLNRQILKWLWKLSEIIHKYPALSSFPAELCSYNLGKQKPRQSQILLNLDCLFLSVFGEQENSGFTHLINTIPFEQLLFIVYLKLWVGLAVVYKFEQNGISSNQKN